MRCDNCGWDNADSTLLCIKCNTPLQNIQQEKKSAPASASGAPFLGTITDGSPGRSVPPVFGGTIPDSQYQPSAAGDQQPPGSQRQANNPHPPGVLPGNSRPAEDPQQDIPKSCPKCRYENSRHATICVICKTPLATTAAKAAQPTVPERAPVRPNTTGSGTIDPYRMKTQAPPACYLQLVPREKEKLDTAGAHKEFISADEPIQLNRNNLEEKNNSITSKVQAELLYEDGKWYLSDRSEFRTTFINVNERIELKEGDIILMGDRKFTFTTANTNDDLPQ